MKSTEKGKRVAIGEIPAVEELMDLKADIDALKAEHRDVFMQYQDLIERYNAKLEEAEKLVRAQEVSCGPFDNFSVSVTYDPDKMFEELGEDMFLKCGGKTNKITKYTADPKLVEAAIAGGIIPEECVDHFRKIQRKYHSPDKLSV